MAHAGHLKSDVETASICRMVAKLPKSMVSVKINPSFKVMKGAGGGIENFQFFLKPGQISIL